MAPLQRIGLRDQCEASGSLFLLPRGCLGISVRGFRFARVALRACGWRFAVRGFCSRFAVRGARFMVRGSRFPVRGKRRLRFAVRGSRFGGFRLAVRGSRFRFAAGGPVRTIEHCVYT